MTQFDNNDWFLAGAIARGIGRTWVIVLHGLSHVEPGEPRYMSAPTLAKAKRWLRQEAGVPLHYHEERDGLIFAYCLDRYVEQIDSRYEEDDE